MTLFPAFLKLEDRLVVVIGGGSIALQKIPALLYSGARVRVIAPRLSPRLIENVRRRDLDWRPKAFEPDDLLGAFLVIAATSIRELNASVFAEAERRNILCNTVDDIDHCHFYYGSVVQRGDLQIAISTNGKSPALAQRLRQELEQQFGPEYALWLEWLGAARDVLRSQSSGFESDATRRWLHLLASRPSFERFLQQARPNSDTNTQGVS
jgi:siroheme synthase-like protein